MGSFITNFHVRGADHEAVVKALQSLHATPSFVASDAAESWVSIFPQSGDQSPNELCPLVAKISEQLHRPAIAFIVHDSDIFCYWLFDNGQELDHYNSAPGYFDGSNLAPEGGDVRVIGRYCAPGISRRQLGHLLRPNNAAKDVKAAILEKLRADYPRMLARKPDLPGLEEMLAQAEQHLAGLMTSAEQVGTTDKAFILAEDAASALADYLGIPERRAINSYRYLEAGEGTMESMLLVEADGVRAVRLTR